MVTQSHIKREVEVGVWIFEFGFKLDVVSRISTRLINIVTQANGEITTTLSADIFHGSRYFILAVFAGTHITNGNKAHNFAQCRSWLGSRLWGFGHSSRMAADYGGSNHAEQGGFIHLASPV